MKIMMLTPYNTSGGAERVMSSLANQIVEDGHEVVFVTFSASEGFYPLSERIKQVGLGITTDGLSKLHKLVSIGPLEIKRYKSLLNVMKIEKPDVVVSFLFMTNIIGGFCSMRLRIPFVLSERNDPHKYSRIKRLIMRYVYSKSSGMICQSQLMKDYAEQEYGLTRVRVIANPISKSQYTGKRCHKTNKIISVGRLIEQKNHEMVIRAFARIAKEFPDYQLQIYGEGPLRNSLEQLCRELSIENRVALLGVQNEVLKKNADAQVFVLGSNYEGYPNVLAEAMANGIISISTDFPTKTAADMIEDGKNGFLIPVGNEDRLVDLLKMILQNPKKYEIIAENGRYIAETTSIKRITEQWLEFFASVIEEKTV